MCLRGGRTLIFQLEVGALTVGESAIFINTNGLLQSVVVGTIVGDIQFTVAIDHGQVTTTIDTSCMLGTHGDEVTMEYIIERGRGVAVNCRSVGVGLVAVR